MQRVSFDAALEMIAGLDDWLKSLGIRPKKDRWHEAAQMLRRAREQRQQIERGGELVPIPNYLPALFEVMEMLEIVRAFSNDSSQVLRDKLERALGGTVSPLDEQPRNSEARNTMFELFLAACWKNGGATVELGEPDIRLAFGEMVFLVECKRPFSAASVKANIEGAARQLKSALEGQSGAYSFGMIAISLDRVFSPGNRLCCAPDGEGRRVIDETLIELIERHKRAWKWDPGRLHQRIAAVMFHLAAPWDIGGERLIYLSTAKFVDTAKCKEGFRALQENVPKLYPRRPLSTHLSNSALGSFTHSSTPHADQKRRKV
jgi:hypothetical protein